LTDTASVARLFVFLPLLGGGWLFSAFVMAIAIPAVIKPRTPDLIRAHVVLIRAARNFAVVGVVGLVLGRVI
jgi:hypothetical protein